MDSALHCVYVFENDKVSRHRSLCPHRLLVLWTRGFSVSFVSTLNEYCNLLACSSKDLAERSGISPSTLSRYRSGRRTPSYDGESVRKLAAGIVSIARERGIDNIGSVDEVAYDLMSGLNHGSMSFSRRLDALMRTLQVSNVEMARQVAVDPSYLSRIRNGRRSPADPQGLAQRCAGYIVTHRQDRAQLRKALGLGEGDETPVRSEEELVDLIARWLLEP
jgi:transcriptional regulator with XRE-family HTH domain